MRMYTFVCIYMYMHIFNMYILCVFYKYVYDYLYDSTITVARKYPELNKFRLVGSYKSSSGSEISLNAMNVPEGSVTVTAGSQKLIENQHYTVDYMLGRVTIIDEGIIS